MQKIKISIAHGSVGFSPYPVMVGHYQGDTITSVEKYLNRCLNERLGLKSKLGLYPGPLESVEIFLNTESNAKPAGGIIVGLGQAGTLTPVDLIKTVCHAALRYATTLLEQDGASTTHGSKSFVPVSLTSVLIGSGPSGISVKESVKSILQGLSQARLILDDKGYSQSVSFIAFEFMELWEDRAILAARALEELRIDPDFQECFDFGSINIRCSPGRRTRVVFKEETNWWRRLRILGKSEGTLGFSLLTDRARTEVSLIPAQRALVDQFIKKAISHTGNEINLGKTLFELLIPNYLKDLASKRENLVLLLNQNAARYPWEMLQDSRSTDKRPLAVEVGVLRQLETPVFRDNVFSTLANTALVIGDPKSPLPDLPSAQEEAQLVRGALLLNGYDVVFKQCASSLEIIESLYSRNYRFLHLTGHGVYRQKSMGVDDVVSGMVIGDGLFLTPSEVEQMRTVPDLVFINCCHLGYIEGNEDKNFDYGSLAANLATQFIRIGVRAVVAAGWAVDDSAAKTFAETFYKELLTGASFGAAVLKARLRTYEQHPGVNTWGAYQCYGDPGYSPVQDASQELEVKRPSGFHMISEAQAEIHNLLNDAATASSDETKNLIADLKKCESEIPSGWLNSGKLRAEFGSAYGELGILSEAITHYKAAMLTEDSDISFRSVEQMANLQSRWAVHLWREAHTTTNDDDELRARDDFLVEIDEAIKLLEILCSINLTSERLSLLGSAYKRKAIISLGDERVKYIVKMRDMFRKSYELKKEKKDDDDFYPLINWITAEIVLSWHNSAQGTKLSAELLSHLHKSEEMANERELNNPSFWSAITAVEFSLVLHLSDRSLSDHVDEIIRGYTAAYLRRSTPRQFNSVLEHLEFFYETSPLYEDDLKSSMSDRENVGIILRELRKACA
ncbi:CHAT domain-containing protein [Halomonas sp.]|uniref:CHAT domain-containing protein n=1 Tax=Halomonas sp. TaxID=1486246 RepID=UPI00298E7A2D|nr:CHAT domain-containing protein [Halomonas sp.]MDW7662470.1 CHAT domain-containing protein [Bacillota bacterium]MDW7748426.1 CHAT domain-containing protein [Halomonas sp.]